MSEMPLPPRLLLFLSRMEPAIRTPVVCTVSGRVALGCTLFSVFLKFCLHSWHRPHLVPWLTNLLWNREVCYPKGQANVCFLPWYCQVVERPRTQAVEYGAPQRCLQHMSGLHVKTIGSQQLKVWGLQLRRTVRNGGSLCCTPTKWVGLSLCPHPPRTSC